MKMSALWSVLTALLVGIPVLGFNMEVSVASSLSFDEEAAKKRPVSKVITLLKDMLTQLEKEGEQDEETYDKMACWCETNDKEKSKSIADAEGRISDLTTKTEGFTAESARLNTEITNLQKEVAENQEALDKATGIREKQLEEFNGEEKDMLSSVSALKSAVATLSKHNTFLQLPRSHVAGLAASVQNAMQKHASLLYGVLTRSERRAVSAFVQSPQSYNPGSGEVFGTLKQMQESFEKNLASAQQEESANQKAYLELKAAKEEEIKAGQEQLDSKTQELAEVDEKNAQAKQDSKDTKKSLAADEKFLAMLKEKCTMADTEWEERQKTRHEEMEAVSKALATLSSDDAHDLFTKTFNPSLLQRDGAMHSERRAQASKLLTTVAHKLQNPRLATLAIKVRLDAFTRVKEAIDSMVAQLVKEKEDEISRKDFCEKEINENELQTAKKSRERDDLSAKVGDLELKVKQLTEAIDSLKAEIAEDQLQLKHAGENREKESQDFQTTVADQRATQKLLGAALNVLKGFYDKKATALVRMLGQAGPEGFKEYKKNDGASGVMGLIEQIMTAAKAEEAEAIKSEEDAQKAHEEFMEETNGSIAAKGKDIVNKSQNRAKAEEELVQATKDKESVSLELEQLANYKEELSSSCDYLLNNFDARQSAREEEIEALKQAKAILSGAKFN